MYFSARHIDIKLNQDYSNFNEDSMVICDGIGEFKDSGIVAEGVAELLIEKNYNNSINDLLIDKELIDLKNKVKDGGTTILFAKKNKSNSIDIEYLGNGGIIHLQGNFAKNVNVDIPYRYAEIMLPHITPKGELDKHLSHNSGKEDYSATKMSLSLNQKSGDILLFFTDGISSLEDKVILKDGEERYWRYESSSLQLILSELNSFLENNYSQTDDFIDNLTEFNDSVLITLKSNDMLEDDASLGIIISNDVLKYYISQFND